MSTSRFDVSPGFSHYVIAATSDGVHRVISRHKSLSRATSARFSAFAKHEGDRLKAVLCVWDLEAIASRGYGRQTGSILMKGGR